MFLDKQQETQRQILAAEMFLTLDTATIKQWLNQQSDKAYQADMRNRFNQLREYNNQASMLKKVKQ